MTDPKKWELRFPEHPQQEPPEDLWDWEAEEAAREDEADRRRKGEF